MYSYACTYFENVENGRHCGREAKGLSRFFHLASFRITHYPPLITSPKKHASGLFQQPLLESD